MFPWWHSIPRQYVQMGVIQSQVWWDKEKEDSWFSGCFTVKYIVMCVCMRRIHIKGCVQGLSYVMDMPHCSGFLDKLRVDLLLLTAAIQGQMGLTPSNPRGPPGDPRYTAHQDYPTPSHTWAAHILRVIEVISVSVSLSLSDTHTLLLSLCLWCLCSRTLIL